MDLFNWCDLITFAWLSIWSYIACRSTLRGERHSVNFLILTHFFLCGVPSGLNLVLGKPLYLVFPSFQSLKDIRVDAIYCAYVCACPLIWWVFGKKTIAQGSAPATRQAKLPLILNGLLYCLAASPIIAWFGSPEPAFYTSYAAVLSASVSDAVLKYHGIINAATLLCVLSIAAIWITSRKLTVALPVTIPFLASAIWLNGKRNIVLLIMVLMLVSLWERRTVRGWKLGVVTVLAVSFFAAYSYFYQQGLRSGSVLSAVAQYDNYRIDYGRDHVIKYALYAELNPEVEPILDYRGQSVLFNLVCFIPRMVWRDKPWPYAVYSTAAALGLSKEDKGWAITTSWLEESIANFGLLGCVAGPFSLAFVCRIGDSSGKSLPRLLTVICVCLSLAVQLSAFMILVITWMAVVILSRRSQRSRRRAGASLVKRLVLLPAH